jgi:Growth regulator
MSVKLKVVQIGNSQGIRLPKPLLEQCGIKKEVEVEAIEGVIVLRPIKKKHRKGWDEAFQEMSRQNQDKLLMGEGGSTFDESEWQWK